jgi:hypothetical protein
MTTCIKLVIETSATVSLEIGVGLVSKFKTEAIKTSIIVQRPKNQIFTLEINRFAFMFTYI